MTKSWTEEEREIVSSMIEENRFHREISESLRKLGYDRSADAVRKFIKREEHRIQEEGSEEVWDSIEAMDPEYDSFDEDTHIITFETITKQKEDLFDLCVKRYNKLGRPKGPLKKIVSISDLHIPFENEAIIANVIQEHAKDTDLLVINGDFFDLYSVSKWPKSKGFLLKHEYKVAVEWLKVLASSFKKIVFTSGNHDERMQSYFASNIDPAISFMVHPDVIERLVSGYSFDKFGNFIKMHDFSNVHYAGGLCSWYTKIGKAIFAHPSAFSKVPMRTAVNTCDYFLDKESFQAIILGHCFDEETEILTKQGWKSINTIEQTDNPITLNLDSGELEVDSIKSNGIFKYDSYKELIHFSNDSGLNIFVTPEHGMVYSKTHGISSLEPQDILWHKKQAQELEDCERFCIPSGGLWNENKDFPVRDEILKILSWIITEGSISYSGKKKNPYIRIYQSDDGSGYIGEIDNILQKLGISYTKTLRYKANTIEHGQHRNYDAYKFYIGPNEVGSFIELLDLSTKTFKHEVLMSLSLRQRLLVIEEMCKGDGSKCGGTYFRHYYTGSKSVLDQFQTLCVLSGIRAKANILRRDGTRVVCMTHKVVQTVNKSERVSYNGLVWCVSVNNGTLIARRNGVPFITQNTHHLGKILWKNKLLIEQGCCCIPMDYEADGKMRFGQQTFGYAVVYMDKNGNIDFEKSGPIYHGTGSAIKTTSDLI